MSNSDRLDAMAQWVWDARARRLPYRNLPGELRPASMAEANAAQEVYYRLAEKTDGAVAGAKIATTTKVMQQLMGIDHPCGGAIFANTIHPSPAKLRGADLVNLRIESEIALRLAADLPASGAPWTHYAKVEALSLIVENCWNGGVVVGAPKAVPAAALAGIAGRLAIGGKIVGEGKADDPCATLAWLVNHTAERGRGLKAGVVVITGSLIPTVSIARRQRAVFTVDGLGEVAIDVL